jgi:hypothetical protein
LAVKPTNNFLLYSIWCHWKIKIFNYYANLSLSSYLKNKRFWKFAYFTICIMSRHSMSSFRRIYIRIHTKHCNRLFIWHLLVVQCCIFCYQHFNQTLPYYYLFIPMIQNAVQIKNVCNSNTSNILHIFFFFIGITLIQHKYLQITFHIDADDSNYALPIIALLLVYLLIYVAFFGEYLLNVIRSIIH